MATWTIQTDDTSYSLSQDSTRVLTATSAGLSVARVQAHTGSIDDLTAWAIRNNELTLQAVSPPDPPGEGDLKLFVDGTTGHLSIMDSTGTVYPWDPRLFAAAPAAPAVKPAPPALESAR